MEPFAGLPVLASVSTWIYVGACVLVPLAWGVATELFFRWLAKGRAASPPPAGNRHFYIDYHI
jgi:hypothetical protein